MKIKIERISSKMIATKFGQKEKVGVYDGKEWYGFFVSKERPNWKEGDEIDVDVEEQQGKDGKTYKNIIPKDGIKALFKRVEHLEKVVAQLIADRTPMPAGGEVELFGKETEVEDLPF